MSRMSRASAVASHFRGNRSTMEAATCGARRCWPLRSTSDASMLASRHVAGRGQQILYLRQHYHFGAARIASYLDRFHGIAIARSSAHRILERHGMHRLPANQRRRRMGSAGSAMRTATWPPIAARCGVLRTRPRHASAAVSIPRHRRLHEDPRAQGLRRVHPARGDLVHRRRASPIAVPRARRANGRRR